MCGHWLKLLRRSVAAGVLVLVPLPAAFALAPEESEAFDAESMVDGMPILDFPGERSDGWNAPEPAWPFGIPRGSEEPGIEWSAEPVRLAG